MKNNIYYIGLLAWALVSACSTEHTEEIPDAGKDGKVKIQVSTKADGQTDGEAFEKGKQIVVYNAEYPENTTTPTKIGIYLKKDIEWENQPTDEASGLWKSDMNKESDGGYCFTAISYFEGQKLQGDGTHLVLQEQNQENNFKKSDFIAARAIYNSIEEWTGDKAVSLLFHHVLSRLDIVVYLPIGNTNDGLFDINIANKPISMTLNNAALSYKVLYDKSSFKNRERAKVQNLEQETKGNITMLPSKGEAEDNIKVPGTETKAVRFRCQSILPPHQYFSSTTPCLKINLDGKSYSYTPESDKIMTFEQARITTVYLVLYSKKGQTKVELQSVDIQPWKIDKTNVGDLIEQK